MGVNRFFDRNAMSTHLVMAFNRHRTQRFVEEENVAHIESLLQTREL